MKAEPTNTGLVVWPQPGTSPRDSSYPGRPENHETAVGWYDDGQGGMVVYAIVAEPEWTPTRNLWRMAPALSSDHFIDIHYGPSIGNRFLAVLPLGASDWCWWHHDGEGGSEPFEATYEDLTPEGKALVDSLAKLYRQPVVITTHIDT